MAALWLVWRDADQFRCAELTDNSEHLLGRTPGATVDLSDAAKYEQYRTVSRQHALIRVQRDRGLLEHVSQSNPTFLNGTRIERATPLTDGDVIHLGDLRLDVHDLAAADRVSGPLCPHCGRENQETDHECWYCGTALVNQRSDVRRRVRTQYRLVSHDGARLDAFPDTFVTLTAAGAQLARGDGTQSIAPTIGVRQNAIVLSVGPVTSMVMVNDRPAQEGQTLHGGDVLGFLHHRSLLLART